MSNTYWQRIMRLFRQILSREVRRHRMEEIGREVALAGEDFDKKKAEKFLSKADKENWEYYIKGFSYGYEKGVRDYLSHINSIQTIMQGILTKYDLTA